MTPRASLKASQRTDVAPESAVDVEITAAADDPAALTRWTLSEGLPDRLRGAIAIDASGSIPLTISAAPQGAELRLARAPRGAVRLRYRLPAAPLSSSLAGFVEADPDRFRADGQALLALPAALDDRVVPVALRIDAAEIGVEGQLRGAASSFGVGAARDLVTRVRDLRRAVYLAGPMGTAVFDAPEGHDEAAWIGYTTFDPRPVSADLASFRTAVGQLFRDRAAPPQTLLIVADARPTGEFMASRRAASVLLHLGVSEPWSAPVRIATAVEVLRFWIGEQLWIGPTEPGREPEAYWFTEGVTRHLARDLLFHYGLISPAELLDELHGLAAIAATSPHRGLGVAELARRAKEPGVIPLLVARGALYAGRLNGLLKAAAPKSKPSGDAVGPAAGPEAPARPAALADLLRDLLAEARSRRGPLPTSAWVDAVSKALGAREAEAFQALLERGERGAPIELPDGALGPCFRGARRRYEPFDLGFDLSATNQAPDRALVGLRADGPAARAGARAGDLLVHADFARGQPDQEAKLTLTRGEREITVRYRPAGKGAEGQGWVRVPGVGDEACVR